MNGKAEGDTKEKENTKAKENARKHSSGKDERWVGKRNVSSKFVLYCTCTALYNTYFTICT